MGTTPSSHATTDEFSKSVTGEVKGGTVGGRKSTDTVEFSAGDSPVVVNHSSGLSGENGEVVLSDDEDTSETEEDSSFYSSDEDELNDDDDGEDKEYDEFLAERIRVMEDARNLKTLAVAFLHPEKPVEADATAFGRNYFNRPSAPEQDDEEEAEERAAILADAAALRKLAADYAHPEKPVVTSDPNACGRCYHDRASAPEQEDVDDAEERAQILADAVALKAVAFDYLHPEVGVTTTDGTAFGRNYFDRPSAAEYESPEETTERDQILADAAALKKLAVDYMHPEISVMASDPTVFGRNYFSRPSAPEQEDTDEADERAEILADAAALKKLAVTYAHPEMPVDMDPTCFGRNYYDRPSAPEQENAEEAEARARVLVDAAALKKFAVHYAHPEIGVTTTDATTFGRNYFERPSATEQEDHDEAEEKARVLADAAAFKKLAVDYAHPEIGVTTSDPTIFGRNYFNRPSAAEQETEEFDEERGQVLADAAALKELAVTYAHPEMPVEVDPTCFGRNYYERPSAPGKEDKEEAEERSRILADVAALKKLAVDYAHPEIGIITTDPTVFGRNYFSRHSASEQEDEGEAEERASVLADATALKKLAVDYMHPEIGVATTDPSAFGRNYFNRPSAPEQETDEDAEERAQILAEAAALKKLAVTYAHPEMPIEVDPTCFGRNYFERPSATEDEEEANGRARVLADAAVLKKLAVDYAHPEFGVTATDPTIFGRNYFSRPSAPEQEDADEAEEHAQVLADCIAIKQSAVDYMHPEVSVTTTDATSFGRNYFERPSAPEQENEEQADERDRVLADSAALKKLAVDYAHSEIGITTTDATAFGRNYFTAGKKVPAQGKEEEEGELSKSASAVMLFNQGEAF